jgi:hypothetical protein
MMRATATIGTTTATAIVPPLLSPLVELLELGWRSAVDAADVDDDVDEPVLVPAVMPCVDVTTVVIVDPPAVVCVITEVNTERLDEVVGVVVVGVFELDVGVVLVVEDVEEIVVLLLVIDVLDEGSVTVELVMKVVDESVEMPEKEGLLLAIELEDGERRVGSDD